MFDPYRKWLGIPTKDQPPHHYRLLSLELFENDPDVIEGAADRVMAFLRQYQSGEHAAAAAKLLNEVALARLCLLKSSAKAQYDKTLREQLASNDVSSEPDADEAAFQNVDFNETERELPRRRKPAGKKSSRQKNANSNWVPVGIFGAVMVVALFAIFIPRQGARQPAPPNENGPVADVKPAIPDKPIAEPASTLPVEAPKRIDPPAATVQSSIPKQKGKSATKYSDPSIVHRVDLLDLNEGKPFKECKGTTLLETPKGLIAAYIGGSGEGYRDDSVWASQFVSGEWTAPVKIVDGTLKEKSRDGLTEVDCAAPVLFRYPNGRIDLFYRLIFTDVDWTFMRIISLDEGKSWQAAEPLPDGFGGPTRTAPQLRQDGSFLCGSSLQKGGWTMHFEFLSPDGKRWSKTGNVNDGQAIQVIEPVLLPHGNGKWQALARSRVEKRIMETWSNDDGKTWQPMTASVLPNPNSTISGIRLKDGRYVVVYNHSETGRTPLNVAISEDGKAWDAALSLEVDKERWMAPSVIQTADELVHVIYNRTNHLIRHVAFDPKAVRLQPIVDGEWPRH